MILGEMLSVDELEAMEFGISLERLRSIKQAFTETYEDSKVMTIEQFNNN